MPKNRKGHSPGTTLLSRDLGISLNFFKQISVKYRAVFPPVSVAFNANDLLPDRRDKNRSAGVFLLEFRGRALGRHSQPVAPELNELTLIRARLRVNFTDEPTRARVCVRAHTRRTHSRAHSVSHRCNISDLRSGESLHPPPSRPRRVLRTRVDDGGGRSAAVHGWVASRRPAGSPQPGSSAPVEVGPPTGVSSVRDTVGGATVSSSLAPGKRRSWARPRRHSVA